MMEYKGYLGKVEFDNEAGLFHGEVVNTRDVITFQGKSVQELKKALRESVEDYLAFCAARGEEPDRPCSGQFVTRIHPELHRQVNLAARISGKSLNAWVSEQLQSAVVVAGITKGKVAKNGVNHASGRSEVNRPRRFRNVVGQRSRRGSQARRQP
jgi:predicted HicB family RNase H-like nuclease